MKLSMKIFSIDDGTYRVHDYDETMQSENDFETNNVYEIVRDFVHCVLPYRGDVDNLGCVLKKDTLPGIYHNPNTDTYQIRYPRGKKEKQIYSPDNIRDLTKLADLGSCDPNSFADMHLEHKASGDIFVPPINDDDDCTSKILKAFITAKQISYSDYGPRIERLSSTKSERSNGNASNNAKRALLHNRSTSASKMVVFGESFDFDFAIVLKDKDGCPNPALNPGEQVVIYPLNEFKIENTINVTELIDRCNPKYNDDRDDNISDYDTFDDFNDE